MPIDPTQQPYLLSEKQNQLLFSTYILPEAFDETAPAVAPKAIFLGGQSGSGKSGLSLVVQHTFSETERAVVINSDALREYHPDFSALQKTNVNQASFLVNPDTIKWQQKLITTAIKLRRNLILDGTLGGNPAPIMATLQRLQEAGYYRQISVLAVPARLSRFGIYKRYEDQVALKGSGRWVGMENHDRLYEEIPQTLTLLATDQAVEEIQLFRRQTDSSPLLFYQNYVQNGQWHSPPGTAKALTEGRNYPWTPDEEGAFLSLVQAVAQQMRQRGANQADIDNFYRYVECPI